MSEDQKKPNLIQIDLSVWTEEQIAELDAYCNATGMSRPEALKQLAVEGAMFELGIDSLDDPAPTLH